MKTLLRSRVLAWVLTLAMVVTFMPTMAFADPSVPTGGVTTGAKAMIQETGEGFSKLGDAMDAARGMEPTGTVVMLQDIKSKTQNTFYGCDLLGDDGGKTFTAGNTLTIESGTYTDITFVEGDGEIIIKGGSFDFDPTEFVNTDEYTVTENSGTYTVEPRVYNLTIDRQDGTEPGVYPEPFGYSFNVSAPEPAPAGYVFGGWKSNEGDDVVYEGGDLFTMPAQDVTLTAQWTPIVYTINYADVPEDYAGLATFTVETESVTLAEPVKEGFIFTGWTYGDVTEPVKEPVVSGATLARLANESNAVTMTANWAVEVSFDANGGEPAPETQTVAVGETAVEPTDETVKEGNTFAGWFKSLEDEMAYDFAAAVTEALNLIAKWTPDTYTVTLLPDGGSLEDTTGWEVTDDNKLVTSIVYGDGLTLPTGDEIKKPGFTFDGWYPTKAREGDPITEISATDTGNKKFYAKWTIEEYAITYEGVEDADNSANPMTYTVKQIKNNDFAIADIAKEGFVFEGWTWGENVEPQTDVIIPAGTTGDLVFTANFRLDAYTVTAPDEVAVASEPEMTEDKVPAGATVTLTVTPPEGKLLKSIEAKQGDEAIELKGEDNAYTFTMPAGDVTVTAEWTDKAKVDEAIKASIDNPQEDYNYGGVFFYDEDNSAAIDYYVQKVVLGEENKTAHRDISHLLNELNTNGVGTIHYAATAEDGKYVGVDTDFTWNAEDTGSIFKWMNKKLRLSNVMSVDLAGDLPEQVQFVADDVNVTINIHVLDTVTDMNEAKFAEGGEFVGKRPAIIVTPIEDLASIGAPDGYTVKAAVNVDVYSNNQLVSPAELDKPVTIALAVSGEGTFKAGYVHEGEPKWIDGEYNGETVSGTQFSPYFVAEALDYTITVEDSENGTVTADKETANVGDTIQLTVEPKKGYHLDQITVTPETINQAVVVSDDYTFTMPADNVTVSATFAPNTYSYVFYPNDPEGTTVEGTMDPQTAVYGEITKLNANEFSAEGYEFVGWKHMKKDGTFGELIKDEAELPAQTTKDGAEFSLYAQWTKAPTISLTPAPIADNSAEPRTDLASEYSIAQEGNTVTVTASDLKKHENALNNKDYWVGVGVELIEGYEYSVYANREGGPRILTADEAVEDFRDNDKPYIAIYYKEADFENGDTIVVTDPNSGKEWTFDIVFDVTPKLYNVTVVTDPENEKGGTGVITVDGDETDAVAEDIQVSVGNEAKTGYTFDSITAEDADGNTIEVAEDGTFTMPGSDVTVTVKFAPNTYEVTFFAEGGTVDETTRTVTYDKPYSYAGEDSVKELPTPSWSGHDFIGWYDGTGDDAVKVTDDTIVNKTADHNLYARWNAAKVTVTYSAGQGTGEPPVDENEYDPGSTAAVQASDGLEKEGYTFAGWKNSYDNELYQPGESVTLPDVSIVLTAQWTEKEKKYTITYSPGEGEGADFVGRKPYAEHATVQVRPFDYGPFDFTAPEDKDFAGWQRSDNNQIIAAGQSFNMPAMDVVLTAVWADKEKTYTVSYKGNGAELDAEAYPESTDLKAGSVFTVEVADPTNGDKVFAGWKATDGMVYQQNDTFVVPTNDVVLTAQWTEPEATYTVTYNLAGGEGTFEAVSDLKADQIFTISDEEPTKDGNSFLGWIRSDNGSYYGASDSFNMPAADVVLTAQWTAASYTVKFVDEDGTTNLAPAQKVQKDDVAAEPQAPEKSGYDFAGWFNGDTKYNFNDPVTGDLTLTAKWSKVPEFTAAPLVDQADPERTELVKSYSVIADYGNKVLKINANDLVKHTVMMGDTEVKAYWTGIGVEILDGYTYAFKYSDPNFKDDDFSTLDTTFEDGKFGSMYFGAGTTYEGKTGYLAVKDAYGNITSYEVDFTGINLKEYDIKKPTTEGGSVEIAEGLTKSVEDATVTVTPAAEDGYTLKGIVVTIAEAFNNFTPDAEIDVVDNGDGTWSFNMPGAAVNVRADVEKENVTLIFDANAGNDTARSVDEDKPLVNGQYNAGLVGRGVTINADAAPELERTDNWTLNSTWYLDAGCTEPFTFGDTPNDHSEYITNDTLTLYAQWNKNYSDSEAVIVTDTKLDDGTYAMFYSQYIVAQSRDNSDRVYRNFFLTDEDGFTNSPSKLPEGLYLNQMTGEVYGIPQETGTFEFYVRVKNDQDGQIPNIWISKQQKITLVINPVSLFIDKNDTLHSKTYGDNDPELLKASSNLAFMMNDVALDEGGKLVDPGKYTHVTATTYDDNGNVILSYNIEGANDARQAQYEQYVAGDKSKEMYAPDPANPDLDTSFSDEATVTIDRIKGENAGKYRMYVDEHSFDPEKYDVSIADNYAKDDEKAEAEGEGADKYNFVINPFQMTVHLVKGEYKKTYGEDDNLFADKLSVDKFNSTGDEPEITLGTEDQNVAIAFANGINDTVEMAYSWNEHYQDAGKYKLYLTNDMITGIEINKAEADNEKSTLENNYVIKIAAYFEAADFSPLTELAKPYYTYTIEQRDAGTFTPEKEFTYGDLKSGDEVKPAADAKGLNLADNEAIGVVDALKAVVKEYPTVSYVAAGTYTQTDETPVLEFVMTNTKYAEDAETNATKSDVTTPNYVEKTPVYTLTVNKKKLTITTTDLEFNQGDTVTDDQWNSLAVLSGVVGDDEVGLAYTYDGEAFDKDTLQGLVSEQRDEDLTLEVTITATGSETVMKNYEVEPATATIVIKAKKSLDSDDIEITLDPAAPYSYTGEPIKPTVTVTDTSTGETVDPSNYDVEYGENTNAGEGALTVTVKAKDDSEKYAGQQVVTADIAKAELAVKADNKSKTEGQLDPPLTYSVTGLKGTDTKESVFTGELKRTEGEDVGTYEIGQNTLALKEEVSNYTFTFTPGTFTIRAQSSGGDGGGTTTYTVTVETAENGSAVSSVKSAAAGATVTITATPAEGYKTQSITAKDEKGNDVTVTEGKDGKYTFKMPASNVTVTPAFAADSAIDHYSDNYKECKHDSTCPMYAYSDLQNKLNEWFHDGIHYCLENGIMNGYEDLTFREMNATTRAEIVTMLWNIEGKPVQGNALSFSDTPANEWYYDAIRWSVDTGIVNGYEDNTFKPNQEVTRQELAKILYGYAKYKGYDVSESASIDSFADRSSVGDWAVPYLEWAVGAKLVQGRDGNQLAPTAHASRAEVATIMMRFCTKYAQK